MILILKCLLHNYVQNNLNKPEKLLHDAYHSALFLPWQRNTWISRVRSISSPGLNQHQGQGSSFICTLWRLLRKTYWGYHKSYCYIPSLSLN